MRYAIAPVALAALVAATPVPQGVTDQLLPDTQTPSDCQTSYDGTFNIQIVNVSDSSAKRSISKRQSQVLTMNLADGVLTDSQQRTGYIAANSQFQFDAPPQTGATITAGWSVCPNGHLTLGDDDQFYSCLSGNFYNLYEDNVLDTDQCTPVYIQVAGGSSGSGAASVQPDGQPTGSAVAPVSQIPDGQITGSAVAPVTQISDGQIQQPTGAVSQIGDGQIQAPTASPVSQIADGQIQAPTASPVSQISDGQIQAPTAAVSQISDGQIQAPTSVAAPVTQIADGQIQAPTGYVSQISDGQIQAPTANGTIVAPAPSAPIQQTGAASPLHVSSGLGLFAAIFGVALL